MGTKTPERPVKNVILEIPATPKKIAKAIFRAADKKIPSLK